jgi:hypothetical protein
VLALLGCGEGDAPEDKYCKACKAAKKDDCGKCSKQIEIKPWTNKKSN